MINPEESVNMIGGVLIQVGLTFLAAAFAALCAILVYYRRRECEMITDRYLYEGIDYIQSELQAAIDVLNHNWARWLDVLKEYREFEEEFDPSHLKIGFIEHQSGRFNYVANFRVFRITNSNNVFSLYQAAIAAFDNANAKLSREFPSSIAFAMRSNKVKASPKELAEAYAKEAKRLWDDCHKWHALITEIQPLADFFECQALTYEKLKVLHQSSQVKAFVANLETRFADELAEIKELHDRDRGCDTDAGKDDSG